MNLEKIKIKRAKENEYTEIYKIIHSDQTLTETFTHNRQSRLINSVSYFIELNNKIIGFISLVEEKEGYGVDIGLIEGYRGKGIGKHCLKYITDLMKEQKVKFFLETEVSNKAINKINNDLGFVKIKTIGNRNIYA